MEHLAEPTQKVLGEGSKELRAWLTARRLDLRTGQFGAMLMALKGLVAARPGDQALAKTVR